MNNQTRIKAEKMLMDAAVPLLVHYLNQRYSLEPAIELALDAALKLSSQACKRIQKIP